MITNEQVQEAIEVATAEGDGVSVITLRIARHRLSEGQQLTDDDATLVRAILA